MKIKILNIKRLFASIIILLLFITIFSGCVNCSILNSEDSGKRLKNMVETTNLYSDNIEYLEQESVFNEISFLKLNSVFNFIKLIFKDNPDIISICQQARLTLIILPDYICRVIYWFIFSPLIQILDNLWNFHPDYMIQYYAFLLMEFIKNVYYSICPWTPDTINTSNSVYKTTALSEIISSAKSNPCPCFQN